MRENILQIVFKTKKMPYSLCIILAHFCTITVELSAESAKTPICGKRDEQCATRARRAMETKLYDEDLTTPINVTKM